MKKIDIAGVNVDNLGKLEAIRSLSGFVEGGKPHLVVTTYSEFVVFASRDPNYRSVINSASLSLPDGIGMIWAAKFLSLPLNVKSSLLASLQAAWQVIYTGASLIFFPNYCRTIIKEQVTGSRLIWDIAGLCADRGYSLALAGGMGGVAEKSAAALKEKFPRLSVVFAVSDCCFDEDLSTRIAGANADILLIAYQPPQQEMWLRDNLQKLNVKACLGLGGTFDYISGKRPLVPHFLHYIGLEWLWRLITQPWRVKRIWNAIPVFIWTVYRYKLNKHLGLT